MAMHLLKMTGKILFRLMWKERGASVPIELNSAETNGEEGNFSKY